MPRRPSPDPFPPPSPPLDTVAWPVTLATFVPAVVYAKAWLLGETRSPTAVLARCWWRFLAWNGVPLLVDGFELASTLVLPAAQAAYAPKKLFEVSLELPRSQPSKNGESDGDDEESSDDESTDEDSSQEKSSEEGDARASVVVAGRADPRGDRDAESSLFLPLRLYRASLSPDAIFRLGSAMRPYLLYLLAPCVARTVEGVILDVALFPLLHFAIPVFAAPQAIGGNLAAATASTGSDFRCRGVGLFSPTVLPRTPQWSWLAWPSALLVHLTVDVLVVQPVRWLTARALVQSLARLDLGVGVRSPKDVLALSFSCDREQDHTAITATATTTTTTTMTPKRPLARVVADHSRGRGGKLDQLWLRFRAHLPLVVLSQLTDAMALRLDALRWRSGLAAFALRYLLAVPLHALECARETVLMRWAVQDALVARAQWQAELDEAQRIQGSGATVAKAVADAALMPRLGRRLRRLGVHREFWGAAWPVAHARAGRRVGHQRYNQVVMARRAQQQPDKQVQTPSVGRPERPDRTPPRGRGQPDDQAQSSSVSRLELLRQRGRPGDQAQTSSVGRPQERATAKVDPSLLDDIDDEVPPLLKPTPQPRLPYVVDDGIRVYPGPHPREPRRDPQGCQIGPRSGDDAERRSRTDASREAARLPHSRARARFPPPDRGQLEAASFGPSVRLRPLECTDPYPPSLSGTLSTIVREEGELAPLRGLGTKLLCMALRDSTSRLRGGHRIFASPPSPAVWPVPYNPIRF